MLVFDEPSPGKMRLRGETSAQALISDETLRIADPTFNPYSVWPPRAKFLEFKLFTIPGGDYDGAPNFVVHVILRKGDDPTLLPGWEPSTVRNGRM